MDLMFAINSREWARFRSEQFDLYVYLQDVYIRRGAYVMDNFTLHACWHEPAQYVIRYEFTCVYVFYIAPEQLGLLLVFGELHRIRRPYWNNLMR